MSSASYRKEIRVALPRPPFPRGARRTRWVGAFVVVATANVNALTADQEARSLDLPDVPPVELCRVVEVGTATGRPGLTDPWGVLADSSHIYVLDPPAFGVHRFDRSGAWLNTIGSEGDGPGEFRRPTAMGLVSDTLWVADRGLSRLSYLSREGEYVRSVRFSVVLGSSVYMPRRALSGGGILSTEYFSTSAPTRPALHLLVFDDEGEITDTLARRPRGRAAVSVTAPGGNGDSRRGSVSLSHPLDLQSLVAYDPLGRWVYVGGWRLDELPSRDFELLGITPGGDTTMVVRLPLARRALEADEVQAHARMIRSALPEALRVRIGERALSRAFAEQIPRPAETAVDAMLAEDDGTVWLRATRGGVRGSRRWMRFRPDVGLDGFVDLLAGHRLLAASGGMLWTVDRDVWDVPTVVGWRTVPDDACR